MKIETIDDLRRLLELCRTLGAYSVSVGDLSVQLSLAVPPQDALDAGGGSPATSGALRDPDATPSPDEDMAAFAARFHFSKGSS